MATKGSRLCRLKTIRGGPRDLCASSEYHMRIFHSPEAQPICRLCNSHFDVSGLVCTADVIHLSSFGGPEAIPSYTLANNLHQSSTASSLRSPPPASSPHEVLTPSSTSMEAIRDAIMMPGQRTQRIDSIESSATGHTVGSSLSSFAPSTAFSTSPATGTSLEAPQPRRIRNLFGNTSVGGRQMLGPDETDPSIWFMFPVSRA